jgi:homoserine dehydrogenase
MKLEDGKVAAYVAPHLVHESSPIAGVDDVFNAVLIRGNAVDEVMFYGRGAGKPTASALIGDVIDAVVHREKRRDLGWSESADLANVAELAMKWYLRGEFSADEAKAACGDVEVVGEGAVITAPMAEAAVKAAAEKLGAAALLRVL